MHISVRPAPHLCVVLLAIGFLLADTALRVHEAQAQQRNQGRPNILEMIFGGALKRQRLQQRPAERQPTTKRVIVKRRKPAPAAPAQPQVVVQKKEDAQNILIVGDFLANGLKWGLDQAYSENPHIVFVDESSGLSGLVRDDVVNWPARTSELIEEHKPLAVIVAVGMNDRQQMRSGNLEKLSEAWRKEYEARVGKVVAAVREKNLPLIWIGLVPVRSARMNADYLVFNEIYRTSVLSAGGSYVDIWDGFTGADGAFVTAGPDINGQIVRLRNSDGINLTNAGKRKLAFYAERELRRTIGIGSDTVAEAVAGLVTDAMISAPGYDPIESGRTIAISLDDPQADGADQLAGGDEFLREEPELDSSAYLLVVKGVADSPKPGRIDATWGPAAPDSAYENYMAARKKKSEEKLAEQQAAQAAQAEKAAADQAVSQ